MRSPSSPKTTLRPKRSLGQNFLRHRGTARRIVAALKLSAVDTVVEIGPGRGALTGLIAKEAGRLIAVEMDDALARSLVERFSCEDAVTIINDDALAVDMTEISRPERPYKMVGNLPYNVASAIIRRFLTARHRPSLMVVMVQREVADSMTAAPGEMTYLSAEVQLRASARRLFNVPPTAFKPSPRVHSAVVSLVPHAGPAVDIDSDESFLRMVRTGFSAPRKQLRNSLRHGLTLEAETIEGLLKAAGIDGGRRAQTLSLSEWGSLYTAAREAGL